jgi:NAD-dependent dihydropyrimidine dehydrogenase PreA subunit
LKINEELCIGCGECLPYCAVGAIELQSSTAEINWDECVECGICVRQIECPVDAFYEPEETNKWPRSVRKVFSDPTSKHENTGVRGRGTEEVKTNDVTARFKRGYVGIALEFGRPGLGTRLGDVEIITKALAEEGIEFESCNPLTFLMEDVHTGVIKEEVRNEKVLSAIVEFVIPEDQLEPICSKIYETAAKAKCIFSWGIVARYDAEGKLPIIERLEKIGIKVPRHVKVNVGLGRPLKED